MIDIKQRLHVLIKNRGWSKYRLAHESGISESAIANWFNGLSLPSLKCLEIICSLMGITMEEFFREDGCLPEDPDTILLHEKWRALSEEQRKAVLSMIDQMLR